jgi:hypothetical protein
MESILLHSANLFRLNLRGINILIPLYLDAMEYYLQIDSQWYINNHCVLVKSTTSNNIQMHRDRFIDIRLKSIEILMSILSLPFHYEQLTQHAFEDYLEKSQDVQTITRKTFGEYRRRILPLLVTALQTEQDTNNAQLLFGKNKTQSLLNISFILSRYDSFGMFIGCSS